MKKVFDFIVSTVTLVAWIVYISMPLVWVRAICAAIIGARIGWSFGAALGGLI